MSEQMIELSDADVISLDDTSSERESALPFSERAERVRQAARAATARAVFEIETRARAALLTSTRIGEIDLEMARKKAQRGVIRSYLFGTVMLAAAVAVVVVSGMGPQASLNPATASLSADLQGVFDPGSPVGVAVATFAETETQDADEPGPEPMLSQKRVSNVARVRPRSTRTTKPAPTRAPTSSQCSGQNAYDPLNFCL